MTVAITPALNAARLSGALAFLDTGSGPARLRIYGGARPASPADAPAAAALAEVALTKPAGSVSAGVLSLTQAEDGLIMATGIATWARLVNGAGDTALDMDCGEAASGADVELASTQLYLGGAVRLLACHLS